MRWAQDHADYHAQVMAKRRRAHATHYRFAFWPTEMEDGVMVWWETYRCRWAGKLTELDGHWIKEAL